ncbi:hypothetical protein [Hymenobacter negativus]|uniref:DUF2490 domain-containing protein n=1 Tax=Hymenobacter negativus TaxID=2795026 RepID=A0ABS3QNF2_9BACT|nr:hypothetical protein [Hymenobacter negativus]MBO2012443.1 hypothetical protein [Hymenobacter negativus]
MKRLLPLALLLASLAAQPAAAQTRRALSGLQLWPELQAELALPDSESDYVLLAVRGQNNTDNNGFDDPNRFLGFDERRVTLNFEHFWNEHWSGGGGLGYFSANKAYVLIPEVLLRHRSNVASFTFGQRLSFERTFPSPANAKGQTNARLRADLEKIFPLTASVALRPRLSYEAATHFRLLKSDTDPDERFIQFTSLRAEVGCRVGSNFDFTPWFAYQTNYLVTLPQYDSMGNQTSGGNLNLVSPVLGIDLRYTILQGQDAAKRKQLPTQH